MVPDKESTACQQALDEAQEAKARIRTILADDRYWKPEAYNAAKGDLEVGTILHPSIPIGSENFTKTGNTWFYKAGPYHSIKVDRHNNEYDKRHMKDCARCAYIEHMQECYAYNRIADEARKAINFLEDESEEKALDDIDIAYLEKMIKQKDLFAGKALYHSETAQEWLDWADIPLRPRTAASDR